MERNIARQHPENDPYSSRLAIQYSGTLAQQLEWDRKLLSGVMKAGDVRSTIILRSGHTRPIQEVPGSDVIAIADERLSLRENSPVTAACIDERAVITPRFENGQIVITVQDQVLQRVIENRKGDWNKNYCKELNAVVRDSMKVSIAMEKAYQHLLAEGKFSEAFLRAVMDVTQVSIISGMYFGSSLLFAFMGSKLPHLYPDTDPLGEVYKAITMAVTGASSILPSLMGIQYLQRVSMSMDQDRYITIIPPYINSITDTIHPNIDRHKLNAASRLLLPGKKYVRLNDK